MVGHALDAPPADGSGTDAVSAPPAPTWTILVPTLGQREQLFMRLLGVLLPQLDEHEGRVRVLAWRNNGSPSISEIRDSLLASAGTDYVSFVDDDDLIPEYYVAEIVRAIAERPDHVGFKLEYTTDDEHREIVDHSLRWGSWGRTADGQLYRDVTHIDPIRTDLALRSRFSVRPGRAEDRVWVKRVRAHLSTEVYIDKIMYHYLWRSDVTAWQEPQKIRQVIGRPVIDHPFFAWHPASDA
jgi:hypothetical protein